MSKGTDGTCKQETRDHHVGIKAKFRPNAIEQDREGHCKTRIVRRQLLTSQPGVGDASQDEDRSNGHAILHSHQWNG